jgi:asparagine synthetase B (glutamine-hydrolysing)
LSKCLTENFALSSQEHQDFSFLQKIDGVFSAVFYDAQEQKVYLISDRRGLRTLYWTIQGQQLLWRHTENGVNRS